MTKDVRVGLVGLGRMGRFHAANLAGRIPGAHLVRIVDANEKVARENSERLGGVDWSTEYGDLLEDDRIEAVIVASPTPLHADMAEAAARAGKHVFCEKPISLELSRTYEVIETVRSSGVKLQAGFHRRFDPDYRTAREKISAGEVGDIYLFRTSLRDMRSPGFEFLKGSGGFFADVTLHDFDTARWMIGEIEEVTAFGAALSDPGFEEIGDIDNAVVVLRFATGALGVIDNSRVAGYGYECSSEIMGSRATLRIGNHRRVAVQTLTPDRVCQDYVSDFVERFAGAYRSEIEHFIRVVREDLEPEVGGADDAAALALSQAAARSYREGRTVRPESGIKDGAVFYEVRK
ncbi:inositol 2-dehydrogenase [Rubrobacter taiwanensis]|jgi:inositol 2-dehydrogenase|uniref:Inositol 2-dehydrogenase n=1 Tax=Rubrobacter taiwanensis TaxID=185139 RepID=A0A4R1BPY6_9ACTN|nr:inositol 2-dehydrogenase [Rubrobacter taiwanensis]TCJ19729.1 inositol 2-dehydrogenase [Rubrobacter taiwanensis]